MIDPEKEIRRRVFNRGRDVPLTYEQCCLLDIKQMKSAEKVEFSKSNRTVGLDNCLNKNIKRRM